MPSYWNDILSTAENRLSDWFERGSGGAVTNPVRDMVNRACDFIWQWRPWDFLVQDVALTVVNKAATLPVDFGRLLRVYADANGDGVADFLWYRNHRDPQRKYVTVSTFSKATGRTWQMQFAVTPTLTPCIRYVPVLDHFTDDDDATAVYLPFPADLVILTAQYRHIIEKGLSGAEMQGIMTAFRNELRDFAQAHQYSNSAPDMTTPDMYMRETTLEGQTLSGETQSGTPRFDSSYDGR